VRYTIDVPEIFAKVREKESGERGKRARNRAESGERERGTEREGNKYPNTLLP
jgi:hypothetical protein